MKKFIILISVYNDWKSVFKLLENIDGQIKDWDAEVSVLIVNDASTEERPKAELSVKNIKSIRVMNMKENWGHTRCNAAGLKHISENENFDYVIPMDGDGEDRPEELNLLFNKSKEHPDKVITGFLQYFRGMFRGIFADNFRGNILKTVKIQRIF